MFNRAPFRCCTKSECLQKVIRPLPFTSRKDAVSIEPSARNPHLKRTRGEIQRPKNPFPSTVGETRPPSGRDFSHLSHLNLAKSGIKKSCFSTVSIVLKLATVLHPALKRRLSQKTNWRKRRAGRSPVRLLREGPLQWDI